MSVARYALVALILLGGLAASYGLAQTGEPQSRWLWQALGVVR